MTHDEIKRACEDDANKRWNSNPKLVVTISQKDYLFGRLTGLLLLAGLVALGFAHGFGSKRS